MIRLAKVYVNNKPTDDAAQKMANVERAIRRFNKEVEKENIIRTVMNRQSYVSKSEKRKAAKKAAIRKQRKQMWKERDIEKYF